LLSEYAGAFYELADHVLTVPPFDVYSTSEAMHRALTMPIEERTQRATALREIVTRKDVRYWFDSQVDDALRALSSQSSSPSTSSTPSAEKSAVTAKASGASSD
jgi:trehalose-6-phosphate synthase